MRRKHIGPNQCETKLAKSIINMGVDWSSQCRAAVNRPFDEKRDALNSSYITLVTTFAVVAAVAAFMLVQHLRCILSIYWPGTSTSRNCSSYPCLSLCVSRYHTPEFQSVVVLLSSPVASFIILWGMRPNHASAPQLALSSDGDNTLPAAK